MTSSAAADQAQDVDTERERKRARDRKSQQAMRNRNAALIQSLTQQVRDLSAAVEEKDRVTLGLYSLIDEQKAQLEALRSQNAALRLQLLAAPSSPGAVAGQDVLMFSRWTLAPRNTFPTCLSDQILQDFLATYPRDAQSDADSPGEPLAIFSDKPNLCPLLHGDQRASDALSNIASDIVRTYKEIESLPNQVAAFCNIASLLKWEMRLDEESWKQLPQFLRPVPEQLTIPHPAWIDRIPWPRVRKYLLERPKITLDDFAAAYSTSFTVQWPYDPSLVIIETSPAYASSCKMLVANPVYEEHMRQIRHWTVNSAFRVRFPEMAALVDFDTAQEN